MVEARACGRHSILSHRAAPWTVFAVAAALRFATLGQQSFWDDEGYTVALMHDRFVPLFHGVARTESAPPTYYVLAWLWTHAFGVTEWGLRSFSAIAGLGTVAVCYWIARTIASRAAGTVAAAVAGVNPLLIWYSQEARAYALFTLFASLTFVFFVRAFTTRSQSPRDYWFWAFTAAASLATHYFALFIVVPEAVLLLYTSRRRWRTVVPPTLFVVATILALVPLALDQRHKKFGFAASSLARRVAQIPEQFLVGYGVWATPWGKLAAATMAMSVIVGLVFALGPHGPAKGGARVLLAVAAAAVGMPIAYALAGSDYVLTLYFIAVLPALVVVTAVGWSRNRFGLLASGVYVGLALVAVAAVITTPEFQREDIRGVAAQLEHPCHRRALVISPQTVLSAYMADLKQLPPRGAMVSEVDLVTMAVKPAGEHETVPRALRKPRPAPGFELKGRMNGGRYTIVAFRAAAPQRVKPRELATSRLGPWTTARVDVKLQTCRG